MWVYRVQGLHEVYFEGLGYNVQAFGTLIPETETRICTLPAQTRNITPQFCSLGSPGAKLRPAAAASSGRRPCSGVRTLGLMPCGPRGTKFWARKPGPEAKVLKSVSCPLHPLQTATRLRSLHICRLDG